MQPYRNSPAEWPIVLGIIGIAAIVVTLYAGCTLHTSVIGHRTDEPVVVVHTPAKPDDDAGAR